MTTKVRPAEAAKEAQIATAEGAKQATVLQGEGEGIAAQKKGEGEAAAIKAKLFAEAEGLEKKAEAMLKFNEAGMGLQVAMGLIDKLPEIIRAAASPITAVDKVQIIDFGGGGGEGAGGGPLARLLDIPPQAIAKADVAMKATLGIGLTDVIQLIRKGGLTSALTGPGDAKTVEAAAEKTIEAGK